MDYDNFDNNNNMNDEKINAFIGIRKKINKSAIIAIILILSGFVYAIVLAFLFAGEDGYVREDAPREWIYLSLVLIILGFIVLILPFFKIKKEMKRFQNLDDSSEIPPEQVNRILEKDLNSLNKGKFIIIMITVVFIGLLIILMIIGKLSWAELIDAIF